MPLHEVFSYVATGIGIILLAAGLVVVRYLYYSLHWRVKANSVRVEEHAARLDRKRELIREIQERIDAGEIRSHEAQSTIDSLLNLVREDLCAKGVDAYR